ncbi:MAG: exosome complex RNA-binding protein Rrp4 [Candidatus Woesearchaeota archaeon]
MSKLLIENKDVVVPGQVVAEGMEFLPSYGTYRLGEQILANRVGVVSLEGKVIKTIPLAGKYSARKNDVVIGQIFDIMSAGWRVKINGSYPALIPIKEGTFEFIPRGADLSRYFQIDEYVIAKVTNITSQNLIDLTVRGQGLHKLRGGRIVHINTHKVPRVIGKKGSMVSMIKQATGCKIIVGQNGIIWISGEDPVMENVAVRTIEKIEKESHISGLTDRIKEHLETITGVKILEKAEDVDDNEVIETNFEESEENLSFEEHENKEEN